MKPEIVELWAQALESGEYDQGRGQLVIIDESGQPSRYCCLGVLCDLANKAGVESGPDDNKEYGWNFGANGATLPEVVIRWAGMNSTGGEYGVRPSHGLLLNDNDSGRPFTEIAAIIREHAEEL